MGQFFPRTKSKDSKSTPDAEPKQEDEPAVLGVQQAVESDLKADPLSKQAHSETESPKEIDPPDPKLESIEPKEIPFLCPIKDHQDYYRPLLMSSEIIESKCKFIVPLLLDFVCGELDHSIDFFESKIWVQIKKALDDNEEPKFRLTTGFEKARLYLANAVDAEEKNTMMMEEGQSVMQTFSPPISEEENMDSSEFWNRFEKEQFESIWYYLNDGYVMNGGDYGEHEQCWWFVGVLNPKKIKAESGKKIYCKVMLKCYYEDRMPPEWSLLFTFSDSNETFWMNVIKKEYLMSNFPRSMNKFRTGRDD